MVTYIDWDDTMIAGGCLSLAQWNEMITYILSLPTSTATCEAFLCSDTFVFYGDDSMVTPVCRIGFDISALQTYIYGSSSAGGDLIIYPNDQETSPFIQMFGGEDVHIHTTYDDVIRFYATDGTYNVNTFIFDYDSLTSMSIILGSEYGGTDLRLVANQSDTYPYMTFNGAGDVTINLEQYAEFSVLTSGGGLIFQVSDDNGDRHVDFFQYDAHQFVLENRTDDPGSPVAGQMWYRTDLD